MVLLPLENSSNDKSLMYLRIFSADTSMSSSKSLGVRLDVNAMKCEKYLLYLYYENQAS